MQKENEIIPVGRFGKTHGLMGWIKVISYTIPGENIFQYNPWFIQDKDQWNLFEMDRRETADRYLIVHVKGVEDVTQIQYLVGKEIGVERSQFPVLKQGQYYWADLIGFNVIDQNGNRLGHVESFLETGAHDVLVITGNKRCLIPFMKNKIVKNIDKEQKIINVDWDSEF